MEIIGYIVGFVVTLAAVLVLIATKKLKSQPGFDERQQMLRYQAYRAAFWVLVAYTCINNFLSGGFDIKWADDFTGAFIGVCLAITVFAVICISMGAYFSMTQKPGYYYALFIGITAINLALGVNNIIDKDTAFFTDGLLNFHAMNLVVVVMFLTLLFALLIQRIKAKAKAE